MNVVMMIVVGSILIYPLIVGFSYVEEFEFRLEVKNFSSPYYTFGVNFIEHSTEDPEYVEQEFIIALYFFTLVFIFYKRKEDA